MQMVSCKVRQLKPRRGIGGSRGIGGFLGGVRTHDGVLKGIRSVRGVLGAGRECRYSGPEGV